jgi:hypothetical protein
VTEEIGRVRETEAHVSDDVRTIERENTAGAWLEGFECRLKGDDRLKEKVAEALRDNADTTIEDVVEKIPDAIRYTFCIESENYVEGCKRIKDQFEDSGHEMYQSKNSWDEPEYRGINTRWVTQDGQRFEVQFHTLESFHAKQQLTHECYERLRNPLTTEGERPLLHAFQREVSSTIPVPDGAVEIPDYKKEGF